MADVSFVEKGYIEVYKGDVLLSRHKQEREAIETVLTDSETISQETLYVLKKPSVEVRVKPRRPVVQGIISGNAIFPLEDLV